MSAAPASMRPPPPPPTTAEPDMPQGGMSGGAGAWMAHVKKTMRANKGKSLKEVLKLAKKTYTKKGTKKTARKSRKSKSWFMGGSTVVPSPYSSGAAAQSGASRRRRGRKH